MNENYENLQVTEDHIFDIKRAGNWAKVTAIAGLITAVLFLLFSIYGLFVGGSMGKTTDFSMQSYSSVLTTLSFFGILISIIYALPCYYLLRFANQTGVVMRNANEKKLEYAFENLKAFFKVTGIIIIVGIGMYILMIFIAIAAIAVNTPSGGGGVNF